MNEINMELIWEKFGDSKILIEGLIGSIKVYTLEHQFGSVETYELYAYSDFISSSERPSFIGTEEECEIEALRLLTASA